MFKVGDKVIAKPFSSWKLPSGTVAEVITDPNGIGYSVTVDIQYIDNGFAVRENVPCRHLEKYFPPVILTKDIELTEDYKGNSKSAPFVKAKAGDKISICLQVRKKTSYLYFKVTNKTTGKSDELGTNQLYIILGNMQYI